MRTILTTLCVLAAALLPSTSLAQFAATQDSTLRGLQRVYVNYTDVQNGLGEPLSSQLQSALTLELRKAGLRLVREPAELDMSQDGILNVSMITNSGVLNTTLILRMDIEQHAVLARTGRRYQMVTWYHEDAASGLPRDIAGPLVTRGVNHFLSQWLSANGR